MDAVTACAVNSQQAFVWLGQIEEERYTFGALSDPGEDFDSLDAKLRTASTKMTVGDAAQKQRDLVDVILSRIHELKL